MYTYSKVSVVNSLGTQINVHYSVFNKEVHLGVRVHTSSSECY